MSREIKFRFWDVEDKEYIADEDITISSNGELFWLHGERIRKNLIPEQFTGLTGKNGVEVCEGDIVELQWKHKTWIEPVVFDCGGFYPFTDTCGQYADPWEVSAIGHGSYKVIGNIHEHKYLLED